MPVQRGGENIKARKVTPQNYPLMKSLLASGLSQADLRRAFKISSATAFLVNKFDTYDEYRENQLKQSYDARDAKMKASTEPVEKPAEKPAEEAHPAFTPNFSEANQERIIELLEQILKKLDCAEMVVSDEEDAPKRRGLFSFGSKSPF
jgi:hypothetical protein